MIRHVPQAPAPRLVLASGSETRRALLAACGLSFAIDVPGVDERAIKDRHRRDGGRPGEAALSLAEAKARAVAARRPDALVIGADQILVCDGMWFDKPATLADARVQLGRINGRAQHLHTAAVLMRDGAVLWRHVAVPVVLARHASDAALDAHVAHEGDALLSCVGACRIEGAGQLLVERVEGEHAAILGLPMLALLAALRDEGILPR